MRAQSPLAAARTIVRNEGISALYSGLSAALSRQAVYTTLRLGLYETLRDAVVEPGHHVSPGVRLSVGLAAGGVASFVSTPIEVAMVRLYVDGSLPLDQRRGYRNVFDAVSKIARSEGVTTLWRGAGPTVARACVVNAVQLGVYDQAKEGLATALDLEGVPLHLAASLTSGFCYSVASLPIDNCKSKMQSQRPRLDGTLVYTSIPQGMVRIASVEGVTALWSGFLPYFLRCGGHTVGMFMAFEQIKKLV